MDDRDFWSADPGTIQTSECEVHIWRATLEPEPQVVEKLSSFHSADEKARSERFHFSRDRMQFLVARGVLRELLGRYLSHHPSAVRIEYGPYGKPYIREQSHRVPIRFSVSHSHGLALFAFAIGREVGVDVEMVRPDFGGEEAAENHFAPREVRELCSLAPAERAEGFFLCWTRKEAYVKARGEGLQVPLKSFRVSLTPGEPARLEAEDCMRWSLFSLRPAPNFVGALVAEGSDLLPRFWQWKSPDV
jgi:4'-phosphopantetheinyl transferase